MSYINTYNLRYSSPILIAKATVAVAKAAQDILNEDPGTANHAQRLKWARRAFGDPKMVAEEMMWGILSNATIESNGEASSDSDVQFTINSLVDTFSIDL